jgi:hypothetical protein
MAQQIIDVHHRSPTAAKISLFRSLFRGREDVYPRRFESRKSGKCGYQPACANVWAAGICQKPKVKCPECSQRRFLPVTDDVIRWHLSGQDDAGRDFVMGVYPMLRDETCFFLTADFDKSHWQEDAATILETCRRMNVPAALERSRSGNGGHVWFFFAEAIPVDPEWKNEYAVSVRRLIRDGVDSPLANLFVHTVRSVPPEADGIERARSATEAFLYRRLETLPETAGRFGLNVELPIPFDGWGHMEVDLLCADARIAVELDGGQHLASVDAYRRDRRKDVLLQENGYFVLRFLAEDVGKCLDTVLDAILRALPIRGQRGQ